MTSTYHAIHHMFRRLLENIQDIILIGLCALLFALMLKTITGMYFAIAMPLDFQFIASELIYILVLVEIYRLLIIYLQEHRIAVDIMIEVGIVSILRETILHGISKIEPLNLAAISLFILVLTLLLRYGAVRREEERAEFHEGILKDLKEKIRARKASG